MASMTIAAPERTWQDELTPVSRSSRRRWALAFALLLTVASWYFATGEPAESGASLVLLFGLAVVFGMLRRGTGRVTALNHPGLDERDVMARDRAYRIAFPLLLGVLAVVAVALVVILPDAKRPIMTGGLRGTEGAWFLTTNAMLGLAILVALWAVFLPTGVLAWTEPDGLAPDPGEPGLGLAEPLRDLLLAASLLVGAGIGVLAESAALGMLPVMLTLGMLGRIARNVPNAPPTARRRTGETATVVILVAFVLLFLVAVLAG